MTCAFLAFLILASQTPDEPPGVKCVLVLPPNEQPWPQAFDRLDTVLKDAQWWYSCQMEGYGYGPKTFSLETDEEGKVVVHIARLEKAPDLPVGALRTSAPASGARSAVIIAAEKIVGNPRARKGTVMVLAYNGYFWTDREKLDMLPMGYGLNGRWAHLTGWHLFGINSKAFTNSTPIPSLPEVNPYFPPIATSVFQAGLVDGIRTVGERASGSHGSFIHEIGHSFGLHHPGANDHRFIGDVMTRDFWNMRGNFVPDFPGRWCCLTPGQAATLDRNPLFQPRKTEPPSTGAPRSLGMSGAFDPAKEFLRPKFASVRLGGSGFTVERFGNGMRSQSNRDYVWKNVPTELDGFRFTRVAGGGKATINVQARSKGRIYVATAGLHPRELEDAGWQLVPPTISYASQDGKRVYTMHLYRKEAQPNAVISIPQHEWTGTIVIAP